MSRLENLLQKAGVPRVISGIGIALLAAFVIWAIFIFDGSATYFLIQSILIGIPGPALFYGGYWLAKTDIRPDTYIYAAKWCFIGIAILNGILMLLESTGSPDPLTDIFEEVLLVTGVGGLGGFGIGVHQAMAFTRAHEAEQRNRELERFASTAAHDLQQPVRNASNYLQLLEDSYTDELSSEGRELVDCAINESELMQQMVQDLLEYSRAQTETGDFEAVDMNEVVDQALANLDTAVEESGTEITRDELPGVYGVETQLVRLFQNLIDNAVKYSGEKTPRIYISADKQGSDAVFSVEDNGKGIKPDKQDEIFDAFSRDDPDSTGTGIGLATSKNIVESHGGRIWVESEPGKGSTFYFTLESKS